MLPFLREGLVLEMHFNELVGTIVYDLSGYSNHGTIYGATRVNEGFVRALRFDGVDDYVESVDLDLLPPFTLMAWIYNEDIARIGTIIAKTGTTFIDTNYWMDVRSGGSIYFGAYDTAANCRYVATAAGVIEANKWYHVAGTYDGSTFKVYVNGTERPEKLTWSGSIVQNDYKLRIGVRGLYGHWFKGLIDEVYIWRRALSASEIRAIYDYYMKKKFEHR